MTPIASRNYYLAIEGQPRGPLNAAMVVTLQRQGTIDGNTLICPEGGAAWVPLTQILAELSGPARPEAPPAMPVRPPNPVAPAPSAPPPVAVDPPPASGDGLPAPVVDPIRPAGYAPSAPAPVVADPPPASGYGMPAPRPDAGSVESPDSRPRFHTPRQKVAPVASAPVEADATKGLRLTVLLAAIGCFFLPWLEFSCSGKRLMSQTGFQTITKSATPDEKVMGGMKAMAAQQGREILDDSDTLKNVDASIATGAALLLTILAFGAAFGSQGKSTSGTMAAMALGCLVISAVFGFPLQSTVKDGMDKGFRQASAQRDIPDSLEAAADYETGMAMGRSMAAEMVKVTFTPWFYVELGALGVAAFLGLRGGNGNARR